MKLQNDFESKIPSLVTLCKDHDVKQMYAFGSVCSSDFGPKSDVDLLVSFNESLPVDSYADNYFSFKTKLEKLLKRKVDLVIERTLRNPYLIDSINKSKTLIYA